MKTEVKYERLIPEPIGTSNNGIESSTPEFGKEAELIGA